MKSSTRLDSAIFQLTPTRTRCDLFVIANEKKEKIASGLLKPFLAHLKTAQDQIAKGGYSILLELEPGVDGTWFTKGTVERFVRFVSTPEVLERVYTTESEILQIEEAIAIQGNNDIGQTSMEDHQAKPVVSSQGNKLMADADEEKAIVLYKPGANTPDANGSIEQEGNSKVQLLKVLETRKTVLQKEQGMAFARAVAAGFDMDHLGALLLFAECFGASRLMDACTRFMNLWKEKHESGQWVEIEAMDSMSIKSDFSAMNASGIMLSSVSNKKNESQSGWAPDRNGEGDVDTSTDERPPADNQIPIGQQEYLPGQFPHPMYPPWPMHSPPGTMPVYPAYPMQGMPYYQSYPGNGQFYQPTYPPMEDPRFSDHRTVQKRQPMEDGRYTESEMSEVDAPKSRSGKKQSGKVVIRNINYITSKNSSGSESESDSNSDTDKEALRSSKRKGSHARSTNITNSHDKEEIINGKETDGGHWNAFQNCLLRDADEDNQMKNKEMFEMEKDVQMKRRQNTVGDDPLAYGGEERMEIQSRRITEFHRETGNGTRMPRASHDEILIASGEGYSGRDPTDDIQSTEINGRKIVHRTANDDFMIGDRENQSSVRSSSDPMAVNGFEGSTHNLDRNSLEMADESFIVPFRSMSIDQVGTGHRTAIDVDYELPLKTPNSENISNGINQVNYEPDDLSLVPERGLEKQSVGYDPALDYEMQYCVEDADERNKEALATVKEEAKNSEKDERSKVTPDSSGKKKIGGPIRKGKPSKMSPLEEARARAEKLRTYKADLQKIKKEKEEEEKKRLEALKIERQKRIAARGSSSSTSVQSPLPSPQTRKQLPSKLSPMSHRGSKFSDSEPGSSSPLQRSKIRTSLLGASDSNKASKISKSIDGSHMGNRLNRSVSSLSEAKEEIGSVTPDSKASMARIRRLSEPKKINRPKESDGPESKKISAIINLDRSKAATLPELKIKTSKGTLNLGQKMKVKANESNPSVEADELIMNNGKTFSPSYVDDNPVVEKNVVMLECEKPSVSAVHASEENTGIKKGHFGNFDIEEKTEVVADYMPIRAPPSPMDRADREPTTGIVPEQRSSNEAMTSYVEKKESPESSSINLSEKPYQAPYARVSSIEDPCTRNSEYGKAPETSLDAVPASVVSIKAHASDFEKLKLEKIPEASEKHQVKESSKGFRRLLKLGRKNSSSTAGSDNASGDVSQLDDNSAVSASSSSEVYTLKNLISQDETPTGPTTSQKSSRHFSLFSPFRSKTGEKKLIT
ncbi:hypothetical protein LguiA_001379 [Lonicera macranthoides]